MNVLTFVDPVAVKRYIDQYAVDSVVDLQPYLWKWEDGKDGDDDSENATITPLDIDTLDELVLTRGQVIKISAAVWVRPYMSDDIESVAIVSHRGTGYPDYTYGTILVESLVYPNEVTRLIHRLEHAAQHLEHTDLHKA